MKLYLRLRFHRAPVPSRLSVLKIHFKVIRISGKPSLSSLQKSIFGPTARLSPRGPAMARFFPGILHPELLAPRDLTQARSWNPWLGACFSTSSMHVPPTVSNRKSGRSWLYQRRFLRPNTHFAAFFEFYKNFALLHRSKFRFSSKFRQISSKFRVWNLDQDQDQDQLDQLI